MPRWPTSSGAGSPHEIKFGQNMSTLTLQIGRSIGSMLGPRDEIVVTTLDHEANVSTWKAMAADRGVTVHQVDIRPDDVTLDLEDLESKLGPRTRLVAVGLRQQRGRDGQPGQGDHRAGARGRGADLRRRRRLRAAHADRRPGARHRLPGDLGLQVVRPAPRRAVRQGRRCSTDLPAFKVRPAARPLRDRDALVRIDRRHPRRHRLPARCRPFLRRCLRRTRGGRRQRAAAGARRRDGRDRRLRAWAGRPPARGPRGDPRRHDPRHHRSRQVRGGTRPDRLDLDRRRPPA